MVNQNQPTYLPSLQGRVFLSNHPQALGANQGHLGGGAAPEALQKQDQLPQFLPRVEWPNPPYTFASRQALGGYDVDRKDNPHDTQANIQNKAQAVAQAKRDYSSNPPQPWLRPIGPYQQGPYRNTTWAEHVAHCHNILTDALPNQNWLSDVQMNSLLTIVSYGLDGSTYFIDTEFYLTGSANGYLLQTEPIQEFGGQHLAHGEVMNATRFMRDDQHRNSIRCQIEGKRWIVAPITANFDHWCMTIFDRENSELYILDTSGDGRDKRIEGICHLWAYFWNRMGLPRHFRYYAPQTLEQPSGWECGYIGIAWVMRNLRDRVGQFQMDSYNPIRNVVRRHDIHIGNKDRNFANRPSQWLSNWQPAGYTDDIAMEGVKQTLSAMLCNELGISDHPCMLSKQKGLAQVNHSGPGAYDRIRKIGTELKNSFNAASFMPPTVPWQDFWTTTGGPQFSFGTASDSVSQPTTTSATGRANQPRVYQREVIETRGARTYQQTVPGTWTGSNVFSFTYTYPLRPTTWVAPLPPPPPAQPAPPAPFAPPIQTAPPAPRAPPTLLAPPAPPAQAAPPAQTVPPAQTASPNQTASTIQLASRQHPASRPQPSRRPRGLLQAPQSQLSVQGGLQLPQPRPAIPPALHRLRRGAALQTRQQLSQAGLAQFSSNFRPNNQPGLTRNQQPAPTQGATQPPPRRSTRTRKQPDRYGAGDSTNVAGTGNAAAGSNTGKRKRGAADGGQGATTTQNQPPKKKRAPAKPATKTNPKGNAKKRGRGKK